MSRVRRSVSTCRSLYLIWAWLSVHRPSCVTVKKMCGPYVARSTGVCDVSLHVVVVMSADKPTPQGGINDEIEISISMYLCQ